MSKKKDDESKAAAEATADATATSGDPSLRATPQTRNKTVEAAQTARINGDDAEPAYVFEKRTHKPVGEDLSEEERAELRRQQQEGPARFIRGNVVVDHDGRIVEGLSVKDGAIVGTEKVNAEYIAEE